MPLVSNPVSGIKGWLFTLQYKSLAVTADFKMGFHVTIGERTPFVSPILLSLCCEKDFFYLTTAVCTGASFSVLPVSVPHHSYLHPARPSQLGWTSKSWKRDGLLSMSSKPLNVQQLSRVTTFRWDAHVHTCWRVTWSEGLFTDTYSHARTLTACALRDEMDWVGSTLKSLTNAEFNL